MPLPKTNHPLFETVMPSTKKMITYRQMLVSDEKILLMAKASEDKTDIYRAVKQIVNNCIFDKNVDQLTTFDIEWMFLKIRSSSIGNRVELSFNDLEDEMEYDFEVDLDEVVVIFPELEESEGDGLVIIDDKTAIKLRYPPSGILDEEEAMGEGDDSYEYIASRCIEKVFHGDETYLASDCTQEELFEYIQNLGVKEYKKVKEFISSTPHLHYLIEYKNSKGTERKIPLTTLTDFFTLR